MFAITPLLNVAEESTSGSRSFRVELGIAPPPARSTSRACVLRNVINVDWPRQLPILQVHVIT